MHRFLLTVQAAKYATRSFGTGARRSRQLGALLLGGGATAATVGGVLYYFQQNDSPRSIFSQFVPTVAAASNSPQPSTFTGTKEHALYLWIHLRPEANPRQCAKVMAQLQKYVDEVCPPKDRDEEDEVFAGVGFGPNFYRLAGGNKAKHNFTYPHRKGYLGEMPSSGGDIFVHAKCNLQSKLFELVQIIMRELPKDSIASFEDTYGWVYKNGRDLSGFIDGTENPADEDDRKAVGLNPENGGSYVITQKWLHQHNVINSEKDRTLENWVGRARTDSTEQSRKSITSHVARMTGGNAFNHPKKFQIVRQSQPFGTLSGDSGLFFIAYAASPENFEFMLDRMVGAGGDGHSDDVMRLSKNTKGTYWYFPGEEELKNFA